MMKEALIKLKLGTIFKPFTGVLNTPVYFAEESKLGIESISIMYYNYNIISTLVLTTIFNSKRRLIS